MTLLRQYEQWECIGDGYPQVWHRAIGGNPAIKHLIRELAGYRCLRCGHPYPPEIAEKYPRGEWTPCDEQCTHGLPFRISQPASGWWEPLEGLAGAAVIDARDHGWPEPVVCAHWRILTVHHLDEDKANCRWWNLASLCQRCHLRMQRAVVMDRVYHFEHSEWFKPFAAGFYAWKYLGEDLDRDSVRDRMDELLALEHRFTQESFV